MYNLRPLETVSKMNNLGPEQKEKAKAFQNLLLTNDNTTIACLRRFNWNLEWAVNSFLENPQMYIIPIEHNSIGRAFQKYLDIGDPKKMAGEGIAAFVQDLNVPPKSILLPIFAWKCRARTQGEFTYDEFRRGMQAIGVETVEELRDKLPTLEAELDDKKKFQEFYNFIFDYGKNINQKEMKIQMAIHFWRLLLGGRFKILNLWIAFLWESDRTSIQRDAWNLFYTFADDVDENLRNHDPADAWPSIIDEFVEWFHRQHIRRNNIDDNDDNDDDNSNNDDNNSNDNNDDNNNNDNIDNNDNNANANPNNPDDNDNNPDEEIYM